MPADIHSGPGDHALLLALFAAPDADHADRLAGLSLGAWEALCGHAEIHRGEALVRRAIQRAPDRFTPPPAITARLDAAVRARTFTALRQARALHRLIGLLGNEGLAPIALKGVRLAWHTYPSPMLRPMRDLDILLPPDRIEQAQAVLLARPDYAAPAWAGRYGVEYGHQLPEIADLENDVVIELHHRLNARGWSEEARLVELVTRTSETIEAGGQAVRVPSAHANLLHLIEHATLHHLFDNGPAVLADLHFIAASGEIDWPRLRAEAAGMGLTRALALVAAIAARHGAAWPRVAEADVSAIAPDQLLAADAALLRDGEERDRLAFLRRLETRTKTAPGARAVVRAALRPGPAALAKLAGTAPANPLRWLAYPAWLLQRMRYYLSTRETRAGGESSRQVRLLEWLHGR